MWVFKLGINTADAQIQPNKYNCNYIILTESVIITLKSACCDCNSVTIAVTVTVILLDGLCVRIKLMTVIQPPHIPHGHFQIVAPVATLWRTPDSCLLVRALVRIHYTVYVDLLTNDGQPQRYC